MNLPLPEGAACANHPETPASWTCGRCGSFMCQACERRVRPEAVPMCPACWELRSRTVVPQKLEDSGMALANVGLALGVLSLVPTCVAAQLGSLIVNIVALVRSKDIPKRAARTRPIIGLCLTAIGVVITIALAMS